MAKAKAKKWNKEGVEALEATDPNRPKFIPADEYEGTDPPRYWKICPVCHGLVSGNRSTKCTGCGAAFPTAAPSAPKATRSPRGAVREPSVRDQIKVAQRLTELLGNNALEILTTLEEIGDLTAARDSIEKWDNLVKAAGSEAKANAMLDVLYPQ